MCEVRNPRKKQTNSMSLSPGSHAIIDSKLHKNLTVDEQCAVQVLAEAKKRNESGKYVPSIAALSRAFQARVVNGAIGGVQSYERKSAFRRSSGKNRKRLVYMAPNYHLAPTPLVPAVAYRLVYFRPVATESEHVGERGAEEGRWGDSQAD